jgi:hypothetical protein
MNDLLQKTEIISEDENLLRRVMFLNPSFIKPDGTPASSSFSLKKGENGLSVDIERLTTHEASILDRTKFRLFQLSAKITTSLGLTNEHDPQPGNYAHALIKGNITRSVSRKMADAAKRVL